METLAILSIIALGLGLLFWLTVPWINPLSSFVIKHQLEYTYIFLPHLKELNSTGSIRRDDVDDFIWSYFLSSSVHALMCCLFMLLLPASAPSLVVYLLVKRALKNKIID